MELAEPEIHQLLLVENAEFRTLADQHRECDDRLEQLARRKPLTEQDWLEQIDLKKRKLLLKDRMAEMIHAYDHEQGQSVTH